VKGYRKFILLFSVLFILYIIAMVNRPKPVDWTVTISKEDKNPYGGFILFKEMKQLFPKASIKSYRKPVYDQLNNIVTKNSAYFVVSPTFSPTKDDLYEMRSYVSQGNYMFIAAANYGKTFLDSFKLKSGTRISLLSKDSTSINFVNPNLRQAGNYTFLSSTIDEYFSAIDTANTIVLGINDRTQPNFIKVTFGDGAFFIHSAPVSFSNYFMLFANNAAYTAGAMSYVPGSVGSIYWDEYYKLGGEGPATPLRLFLNNTYLSWALRLAVAGLLIYIFFEMKRRQRVIPVIAPLRNSTLDFVQTVAGVYFNQRDNGGIADKKITYFLAFVRTRFYINTNELDEAFIAHLSRKSGVDLQQTGALVQLIQQAKHGAVSDQRLMQLDQHINNFYKQV